VKLVLILNASMKDMLRAGGPPASVLVLLERAKLWLNTLDPDILDSSSFDDLRFYATADLQSYPVEYSEEDPDEEWSSILRAHPSSVDTLVMLVRDLFWRSMAFHVDRECPRCGDGCVRAQMCSRANVVELFVECDICLWNEAVSTGSHLSCESVFLPTTQQLHSAGLV